MIKLVKTKVVLVILLLTTPGIWQVFFHTPGLLSEWKNLPVNIIHNVASKSTSDYQTHIFELRWGGRNLHRDNLFSKLVYNQPLFYINEGFEIIQFATPKLYFLAGDGSQFSPRRIEPISFLLFPFWIFGLLAIISQPRIKLGLAYLGFLGLGYLSGRKNLAILLPLVVLNVYISYVGLLKLEKYKHYGLVVCGMVLYGIYITAMNIWLNVS